MALLILSLVFFFIWHGLLVRHALVGACCFTTTSTLQSLMSLFTTVVTLPSKLPVHHTKFHWCIPRLVTL